MDELTRLKARLDMIETVCSDMIPKNETGDLKDLITAKLAYNHLADFVESKFTGIKNIVDGEFDEDFSTRKESVKDCEYSDEQSDKVCVNNPNTFEFEYGVRTVIVNINSIARLCKEDCMDVESAVEYTERIQKTLLVLYSKLKERFES